MLLNAGILFLLRWALDDTSEAVIAVAVQGFAAVLIVPCDKVAVSCYFTLHVYKLLLQNFGWTFSSKHHFSFPVIFLQNL